MGAGTPETHFERHFTFEDWGREDEGQFLDYADFIVDVVRNSSGTEPVTEVKISTARVNSVTMSLPEFRERIDEYPLDRPVFTKVHAIAPDGSVSVSFGRPGAAYGGRGDTVVKGVTIVGADKASVEGAKARIKQDGEGRIERRHREQAAEIERERQAQVTRDMIEADRQRGKEHSRSPKSPTPPEESKPSLDKHAGRSRIKKVLYDPWVIGVTLVILAAVLTLLLKTN